MSAYAAAGERAAEMLDAAYDRIEAAGERPVWISLVPRAQAQAVLADALRRRDAGEHLPLLGVPFALKDNIDLAGLPTTAGCPDFAYMPQRSAFAVERLVAAGAIPVGKTNLDQFATGLNGTRSPYGIPRCAHDPARVSGGSSSGSAVAVATGLVPFALGTDTAGSGRVPAGFNGVVGLKPTKGLISTGGVVPACRSQDCVSVFAATVGDALAVARVAAGFDPDDPFSRAAPAGCLAATDCLVARPGGMRFGVPPPAALAALDYEWRALFEEAARALESLGGTRVEFEFAPFQETAGLLYAGPWVAERLAAVGAFAVERPGSVHPVVADILRSGARYTAVDAFEGQYRLAALLRQAEREWARMDVMLLPTAPHHPTVEAMLADPVRLNAELGAYTNFVNLMDLAALAVPAGTAAGLPFGVTLVGRAFKDGALALVGDRLHRALLADSVPPEGRVEPEPAADPAGERVLVAVVGAHLAGQPLNPQLTRRDGRLVRTARTAAGYSLYALPGAAPRKPGLVRDGGAGGIEVEVWSLPVAGFGAFVAEIPPPLGIGTLALADGTEVKGFVCEPHALQGAESITHHGGWRAFLASQPPHADTASGEVQP